MTIKASAVEEVSPTLIAFLNCSGLAMCSINEFGAAATIRVISNRNNQVPYRNESLLD